MRTTIWPHWSVIPSQKWRKVGDAVPSTFTMYSSHHTYLSQVCEEIYTKTKNQKCISFVIRCMNECSLASALCVLFMFAGTDAEVSCVSSVCVLCWTIKAEILWNSLFNVHSSKTIYGLPLSRMQCVIVNIIEVNWQNMSHQKWETKQKHRHGILPCELIPC